MSAAPTKFMPRPTPATEVYWQGCRNQQLLIQHCKACDHYQFYPRSFCTRCAGPAPEWIQATGRGTVESFTVVRTPVSPAYSSETPYIIVLVHLDEGPVMMSKMTACDENDIFIGMQVVVDFEDWSETIAMPVFRPVEDPG